MLKNIIAGLVASFIISGPVLAEEPKLTELPFATCMIKGEAVGSIGVKKQGLHIQMFDASTVLSWEQLKEMEAAAQALDED